jgi:hypothetical protein
MADASRNEGRLDKMFEPHEQKLDVLKEALKEVSEERAGKRKDAAKELIRKALDLKEQKDKAKSEFLSKDRKWEKELGKVMGRLENMAQGKPLNDGVEDDDESEE